MVLMVILFILAEDWTRDDENIPAHCWQDVTDLVTGGVQGSEADWDFSSFCNDCQETGI